MPECAGCGEVSDEVADCTFALGVVLRLCDACGCGYTGGGEGATEGMVEQYLGPADLYPDPVERMARRDQIAEAHGRMPLHERGARVASLLAAMN